jgi:hypothetical protein
MLMPKLVLMPKLMLMRMRMLMLVLVLVVLVLVLMLMADAAQQTPITVCRGRKRGGPAWHRRNDWAASASRWALN